MQRVLKQIVWLAMLVFAAGSAKAFSLIGPIGNGGDAWQTPIIAYGVGGDIGAPKAFGQGYRRNIPVLYYAADAGFWTFFSQHGMDAVDQAFTLLNNVTNVGLYSQDLSEWPQDSQRVNLRAASLALTDLKSVVLGAMTEEMGLFQPTRSVWVLRSRFPGPACPLTATYTVTKRNMDVVLDPATDPYTSYVNGTLYSYFIFEACGGPNPLADAVEFPADPLANTYTAVADFFSEWYLGLDITGGYYTSLTRDDVAGLRYLYETNNYAMEDAGVNVQQILTNAPALLTTFDLNTFAQAAATNGPVALVTLYPGLVITGVSNSFTVAITTNVTETLTNSPFDPAGFFPTHPSFTTNYLTNALTIFHYTFGNLVTNSYSPRGLAGTVTTSIIPPPPNTPAGFGIPGITNKVKISIVNGSFGDFYLIPTNACGVQVLSNLLTQVVITTNLPVTGGLTNGATGTNIAVTFVPGNVTFATNHLLVYLPIVCLPDTVDTRQGLKQITFLRRDFDSLLNQFWTPVTNDYTVIALTNGILVPEHMRRTVVAPDFLFRVSDQPAGALAYARNIIYDQAHIAVGEAGPGTIVSPTVFTINDVGPLYFNSWAFSLTNLFFLNPPTEATQTPAWFWGSFDGSTNDPIVYPNGTSLIDLEKLVLSPVIVNSSLPNGEVGAAYSVQLTGHGGQAPYVFTIAPNSGLPAGLNISPDGLISGTPTGPVAIYDVTIRITDSASNYRDVAYTITIDP
jgi:hypothetical protein